MIKLLILINQKYLFEISDAFHIDSKIAVMIPSVMNWKY